MRIPVSRHGQIAVLAYGIGLIGSFLAATPDTAIALTPKSPEVVSAIERGVKYLETASDQGNRIGACALQGICLLKQAHEPSHPKIVGAAERIHTALGSRNPAKLEEPEWDIYCIGLAIIFLVELDSDKYHADIECLLASLRKRQKPHGGWGYSGRDTGDTSMTQYGVLSSWVATQAGFKVPVESIESVTDWLLRTQDPSGGFGYQGTLAPNKGALVPQAEIRPSMTAAGSGSLYICASLLGLIEKVEKRKDTPSALKEVKPKETGKEKPKSKFDVRAVREAEARAKTWLEANGKIDPTMWAYYYLYAQERCMSFREIFDQRSEKEPAWYDEGAEFLLKNQGEDGSWSGQCGSVADTSFAVLFLMRSTKKAIEKALSFGEGTMVGGRGIPKDTGNIMIDSKGQIVARPLLGPAEKLLASLEQPDGRDFDKSVELLAALPGSQIESLTAKYGDKIRQLVGNKSPEARLAAVRTLGKTRNLDNVETLIYALTDPDPRVVRTAHNGLLRIRRSSMVGNELPETFSDDDRRKLVDHWKNWYQSIRPGTEMR